MTVKATTDRMSLFDKEALSIVERESKRRGDTTSSRTLAKIVIEYPKLVEDNDFLRRQLESSIPPPARTQSAKSPKGGDP